VWIDLNRTGSGDNEAWTRDGADVNSGTWRAIANLGTMENLIGTQFADKRFGDANVNRLEGGAGNDQLTGRGGNDVFVFRPGFGADTITDFTGAGATVGDQIQLSLGPAFDDFAEVQAVTTVSGGNTVIDFGGGSTITLTGVTAAMHQNDFLFA
jgi:Ca2+-binding RTX toxin-like protein